MHRASLSVLMILCVAACDPPCLSDEGTRARFILGTPAERFGTPEAWLAQPFPSDARRNASGTISLFDFPAVDGDLFADYARVGEAELRGFSTNGAVHVSFDGAIDDSALSKDPGAFVDADAPMQIVDVSPGSPQYGRRRPLRWSWRPEAGRFVPRNTLSVAPAWGFPLRDGTTYALLVTDELQDTAGRPLVPSPALSWVAGRVDACETPVPALADASFEPLRRFLVEEGTDPSRVVAATVFTTQEIGSEVAAMRRVIHEDRPAPAYLPEAWVPVHDGTYGERRSHQWNANQTVRYWVMEGALDLPNFQVGAVPYSAGGGLRVVDGRPEVIRTERVRFVLTVPVLQPSGPCFPLVQYAHGTGGSAEGIAGAVGGRLAARGMAGIAIDLPLHGPRAEGRSFDVTLMTFNLLNIASARTVLRQSAADTFALTRFVRESLEVPAEVSPTGEAICFDRDKPLFFGHSQGAMHGSIAAAFETDMAAWVLSATGGGVSVPLLERKDIVDLEALLRLLSGMEDGDEELDELHPLLTFVQTLTEVVDPLNYARLWRGTGEEAPRSILMTSGGHDSATLPQTSLALSVAAELPLLAPAGQPSWGHDLLGLAPLQTPASGNYGGATSAHLHWPEGNHFIAFNVPEVLDATMSFLHSAAFEEAPVLTRNPTSEAR